MLSIVIGGLLGSLAACSTKQDYTKQYVETYTAQGIVPGSAEHDRCVHDLIARERAREELERSQFETLQSIERARPLLPH